MMIAVAITADSWGTMLTNAHALDSNISKVKGKALRLTAGKETNCASEARPFKLHHSG
jgi:hypothetical protein